jgi:cyclopropane-fatty-acyl-phospholipid synthase
MFVAGVFNSLLAAVEAGRVPDSLTRRGIRGLLRQRLLSLRQQDREAGGNILREFIAACRTAPIACLPEAANEQHYEVAADFFAEVLGPWMKYSCCYWPEGVETLAQAEAAALETTCRRAGIEDGMQVLDLGCGWGSFSLWTAERFPNCRITAVSNSARQLEFIEDRAVRRGVTNLRVLTADMNAFDIPQQFDRVVSVEMFEHMRNHAELLRKISNWLKPDGRLFVHIFAHRDRPYLFEDHGPQDWMTRHFFSGGMMPSDDLLLHYQRDLELMDHWRWNGTHYEKTCNAWLARLDMRREEALTALEATYGGRDAERWLNRWRVFFMACAELFGYRGGDVWFVSHYLFANRNLRRN